MDQIGIETTRYTAVVRAFLEQHPNAVIYFDKRLIEENVDQWCTNKILSSLRDFSLRVGDQEVLSFHDHPSELMAPETQLPLVKILADQKVLRYRILHQS